MGDWSNQAQNLKKKFPQLNDADLKFEEGKDGELVTRIAEKLNKHKDEVINIIKKGQPEKA